MIFIFHMHSPTQLHKYLYTILLQWAAFTYAWQCVFSFSLNILHTLWTYLQANEIQWIKTRLRSKGTARRIRVLKRQHEKLRPRRQSLSLCLTRQRIRVCACMGAKVCHSNGIAISSLHTHSCINLWYCVLKQGSVCHYKHFNNC